MESARRLLADCERVTPIRLSILSHYHTEIASQLSSSLLTAEPFHTLSVIQMGSTHEEAVIVTTVMNSFCGGRKIVPCDVLRHYNAISRPDQQYRSNEGAITGFSISWIVITIQEGFGLSPQSNRNCGLGTI